MTQEDEGMLRDIFAGLAMCAWIINGRFPQDNSLTVVAYNIADEMMKTRLQEPKEPQEIGIKTVRKGKKYDKTV